MLEGQVVILGGASADLLEIAALVEGADVEVRRERATMDGVDRVAGAYRYRIDIRAMKGSGQLLELTERAARIFFALRVEEDDAVEVVDDVPAELYHVLVAAGKAVFEDRVAVAAVEGVVVVLDGLDHGVTGKTGRRAHERVVIRGVSVGLGREGLLPAIERAGEKGLGATGREGEAMGGKGHVVPPLVWRTPWRVPFGYIIARIKAWQLMEGDRARRVEPYRAGTR